MKKTEVKSILFSSQIHMPAKVFPSSIPYITSNTNPVLNNTSNPHIKKTHFHYLPFTQSLSKSNQRHFTSIQRIFLSQYTTFVSNYRHIAWAACISYPSIWYSLSTNRFLHHANEFFINTFEPFLNTLRFFLNTFGYLLSTFWYLHRVFNLFYPSANLHQSSFSNSLAYNSPKSQPYEMN